MEKCDASELKSFCDFWEMDPIGDLLAQNSDEKREKNGQVTRAILEVKEFNAQIDKQSLDSFLNSSDKKIEEIYLTDSEIADSDGENTKCETAIQSRKIEWILSTPVANTNKHSTCTPSYPSNSICESLYTFDFYVQGKVKILRKPEPEDLLQNEIDWIRVRSCFHGCSVIELQIEGATPKLLVSLDKHPKLRFLSRIGAVSIFESPINLKMVAVFDGLFNTELKDDGKTMVFTALKEIFGKANYHIDWAVTKANAYSCTSVVFSLPYPHKELSAELSSLPKIWIEKEIPDPRPQSQRTAALQNSTSVNHPTLPKTTERAKRKSGEKDGSGEKEEGFITCYTAALATLKG